MRILHTNRQRLGLLLLILALASIAYILLHNPAPSLHHERQWDAQDTDIAMFGFTPDSQTLLSPGDELYFWNPATGALKSSLSIHASPRAISPAGDLIACSSTRRPSRRTVEYGLELWDLNHAAQLQYLNHLLWSPCFSPDGRVLAAVTGPQNGGNSTIELYSLPSMSPLISHPRQAPVGAVCFSPDGKTLASVEGNTIKLLDPRTARQTATLTGPIAGAFAVPQYSPDGKLLRVLFTTSNADASSLWTFDLATGTGKQTIAFDHPVRVASFCADGTKLVVLLYWFAFPSNRHDRVEVWDTIKPRKIGDITARTWISTVCMSPDGARVAVGFQQPSFRQKAPIAIWSVR